MRQRIFLLIIFCLFSAPSFAQVVEEVVVEGNTRLSDEAVKQYMTLRPELTFRRNLVRDDLHALYNTGLFEDVQIDVEQTAEGYRIVVAVEERAYIQKVQYIDNESISDEDLKEASQLEPPFLWDEARVSSAIERMRKRYRDQGYYLVTIRPEIVTQERRRILEFEVDEGHPVEIKKIYFQGNDSISDEALRSSMISKEGAFWGGGTFDEDLLTQIDTRRIQLEYLKKGFAYVRVDTPSVTFTPDREGVIVSYHIQEGESYDVGEIHFSGDLDFIPDPDALRERLKSQPGEVWNYENIQNDIQHIQDVYGDEGYAYANVIPRWEVNLMDDSLLDINYRIDKGEIVYFGDIDFRGNFETLDRVLRRELEFSEGELFQISKYRQSRENLERLGYFESVRFIQEDVLDENRMDVIVEVEEQRTGTLTFGASFSSFDRFGLQGSLSKANLFGRGYHVNASLMFSSRRQIFSAYFRNPRIYDSKWSTTVELFNRDIQSLDETRIRESGGSLSLGYPLGRDWRISGRYSLKNININIRDLLEIYYPDSFGFDSSVRFRLSRDTLDVPEMFLPSKGSENSFSATVASDYLGSDMSYLKLAYQGRKYYELIDKRAPILGGSVLSFGLRLDYLTGIEDRTTPYNERFVPGGIYSIRGHPFRSLGPSVDVPFNITGRRDDDRELGVTEVDQLHLGGNKQMILNVEYLFDIFREAQIKGVVFFDAGNTFPEGELDIADIRYSTGFGFRWFSPMGPLRFEWGIPLDRREDEESVLFDFSIGAPF